MIKYNLSKTVLVLSGLFYVAGLTTMNMAIAEPHINISMNLTPSSVADGFTASNPDGPIPTLTMNPSSASFVIKANGIQLGSPVDGDLIKSPENALLFLNGPKNQLLTTNSASIAITGSYADSSDPVSTMVQDQENCSKLSQYCSLFEVGSSTTLGSYTKPFKTIYVGGNFQPPQAGDNEFFLGKLSIQGTAYTNYINVGSNGVGTPKGEEGVGFGVLDVSGTSKNSANLSAANVYLPEKGIRNNVQYDTGFGIINFGPYASVMIQNLELEQILTWSGSPEPGLLPQNVVNFKGPDSFTEITKQFNAGLGQTIPDSYGGWIALPIQINITNGASVMSINGATFHGWLHGAPKTPSDEYGNPAIVNITSGTTKNPSELIIQNNPLVVEDDATVNVGNSKAPSSSPITAILSVRDNSKIVTSGSGAVNIYPGGQVLTNNLDMNNNSKVTLNGGNLTVSHTLNLEKDNLTQPIVVKAGAVLNTSQILFSGAKQAIVLQQESDKSAVLTGLTTSLNSQHVVCAYPAGTADALWSYTASIQQGNTYRCKIAVTSTSSHKKLKTEALNNVFSS